MLLHGELVDKETKKKVPILGHIWSWMGGNDMDYGPLAAGVASGLLLLSLFVFGVSLGQVLSVFFALTPVWLPILLFYLFFQKWMEMVGSAFALAQGRTSLRLRLPQEVLKSPEAMEVVISQIHNTANPDNLFQTYIDGKRPLPFSFEIVSIGGEVRFYVNVQSKPTRNAIEAALYSQYPGVEVVEEEVDYAAEIPLDYEEEYELMSFHMGKKRDGELPIKTYIDYGLDKMPKEEEKLDPITPMLEVLSTIKPHERVFIQIIATSFRKSSFKNGQLMLGEGDDWTAKVVKKINDMMNRDPKTRLPKVTKKGENGEDLVSSALTSGERDTISAMERQMTKYAFKTAIRWMYITKKGKFNAGIINPVIRSFSQYDMIGRNEIGVRWRTDMGYKDYVPGQKKAIAALKKQELKEYRRRSILPKNGAGEPKIFTAEELATMFHLPGRVALTPTLDRVPSARGEAPANLPIGELPQ